MKMANDRKPANVDSTIRIVKAFYKMGDLDAMKHYLGRGKLAVVSKNPAQEKEVRTLENIVAEMETFETENGRGSCLQLEHRTVENLIKDNFYPKDVVENARKASWKPTAYFLGWRYPTLRRSKSSTFSKVTLTNPPSSRSR